MVWSLVVGASSLVVRRWSLAVRHGLLVISFWMLAQHPDPSRRKKTLARDDNPKDDNQSALP
jgi:hypothetical protein